MLRSLALSIPFIAAIISPQVLGEDARDSSVNQAYGNASILIVGATRGTGLKLAKLLVARGDEVTALVRPSSDLSKLEPLAVRLVTGDALNRADVEAAFAQGPYQAVVSTIGCFRCEQPPDYVGNKNIFDTAAASNNRRVIMISTIGAGASKKASPWISRWLLKDVIVLKEQAEQHLIDTGLDYTIIRPGGLKEAEATGNGMLTEDSEAMGIITRADLARLLVQCIDDKETIGKTYSAVDSEMTWPWDMWSSP
ncbi:uncharacterized protein METZ01_LOCUS231918 [marine metagenome]|uniref:NAD(P)-binding domain-containing protein n=1 Tax=marine metagenome TaxID=408172 RepID=A0A382GVZ9_9ZZZZ